MAGNTVVALLAIVLGGTVFAIAGLLAVNRWLPQIRRQDDEGPKGVFFSMVGVLYAVLLAFVVVLVWSDFVDAGHNSHEEATRISNLIRNARAFPPAEAERFRSLLVTYSESVAGPEWETMAEGDSSPITQRHYDAVWDEYYRFTPATEKASAFYAQSISRLNDLGEARRLRLLASRATVPTAMWMLLIVGFVVTIAWTYVFRLSSVALDIVAVGSIAALTGFVLFLIYALQHPFAGDVKISPEPFLQVARQFGAGG